MWRLSVQQTDPSDFVFETIRAALARGERIVRVTAPEGAETAEICRTVERGIDSRTFVARVPASIDDGVALLSHLSKTFGLIDGAKALDADKLQTALCTFFEGLESISACSLVLVEDQDALGADARVWIHQLLELARARDLPVYAVFLSRATAAPAGYSFGRRHMPAYDARRQAAAVLFVVMVAIAVIALLSREKPVPRDMPPTIAEVEHDIPLPPPAQGLMGTGARDAAARVPKPLPSTGVLDLRGEKSADAVLQHAKRLARQPDVRGLLELRNSVSAAAKSASAPQADSLLKQLDALVDEARRRQLDVDHQRLAKEH